MAAFFYVSGGIIVATFARHPRCPNKKAARDLRPAYFDDLFKLLPSELHTE